MLKYVVFGLNHDYFLFLFQLCEGFEDSGAHAIFLPKALPVAQIVLTGSIYTTLAISIERWELFKKYEDNKKMLQIKIHIFWEGQKILRNLH